MTYGMSLNIATCTSTNTTCFHVVIVTTATNKFVDLVVVIGKVVCYLPTPIFCLDRTNGCSKLETSIVQRTNIAGHLIAEVRTCRNIYRVNQVFCLTIVPIEIELQTVVQESQVNTDIPRSCLFPCQIRVISIWTIGHTIIQANVVICMSQVRSISRDISIVTNSFLLTGNTPT